MAPGRVWTREQLLDRVWGRDIYVDTRTIDVHVGRLRKALMTHGGFAEAVALPAEAVVPVVEVTDTVRGVDSAEDSSAHRLALVTAR